MGNSNSSSSDPHFASASRAFTQKELEDLKSLFVSLSAQSNADSSQYVSPSVFKACFGIDGRLGDRLFDLVSQKRNDQRLTFEDLVIAKGIYEKGTNVEIEEFIYQLLDVTADGFVSRSDVEVALSEMLVHIFSHEHGSNFHQHAVNIFLESAKFSGKEESLAESIMSFDDFKLWCSLIPSIKKYLGSLLIPSGSDFQVPDLVIPESIGNQSVLLQKEYAWHIGGALNQHDLEEWRLLYHSSFHGLSFNTFFGNISNYEGPTLLIVKDKEGYIYGGYASQAWEKHADFYGDMKSFLFQLYPKASIYRPTGANKNLQWCGVNFSSEDIPNGIGFGGRPNHFGFFISASFDQGHTFACTTFGSPSLSRSTRINPEVIECWAIVPKGNHQEKQEAAIKGTVLERFKEDRHMLNMVGLANSSE
ncbi:MTOR-associated protein MEAK7 [Impatiens glandulifera]|uniref:MTOR-associated protein MEAK7 n=1 Tax=Impatiens glandulifera TaxID=253017 RepID=UPI001FB0818F|nr:MTOR-associated protein MEAK7 [Impatiens glandulifera]